MLKQLLPGLLALFLLFPLSLFADSKINVNSASAEMMASALPNIGQTRANAIVTYRTENGPFRSIEELVRVSGIGPKIMDGIRDRVKVSDEPTQAEPTQVEPTQAEPTRVETTQVEP